MFYWLLKIAVAAVVASELKADIRGKPDNTTWCHAIQFVQEIFQKKSYKKVKYMFETRPIKNCTNIRLNKCIEYTSVF